ncbi:MAG: GspH/FimT family pseudopilin [Rubrivivax sp.]|nr:GspH/FimT family pseudopilin [Rubrivivax sp.]
MKRNTGITLIELLVVIALIGAILALAAPAFKDMILMQRLRGISSALVTDLQFARAEAVSRRQFVRLAFRFDTTTTCYTIYTSASNATRCDCRLGPQAACTSPMVEIKTVMVPSSLGVEVKPTGMTDFAFAFDWRTGSLLDSPTDDDPLPTDSFVIQTSIDAARKLHTRLNMAGRPLVCKPSGSTMTEPAC